MSRVGRETNRRVRRRWRYGRSGLLTCYTDLGVEDAVFGGEERWRVDVRGSKNLDGVTDDYAFVVRPDGLRVRRTTDGSVVWTAETDDWNELWRRSVGDRPSIHGITAVHGGERDGSVYVATENAGLVRIGPDGERQWRRTLESDVSNVLVDGRVHVGAAEGVYALDPSRTTPNA